MFGRLIALADIAQDLKRALQKLSIISRPTGDVPDRRTTEHYNGLRLHILGIRWQCD